MQLRNLKGVVSCGLLYTELCNPHPSLTAEPFPQALLAVNPCCFSSIQAPVLSHH